VGEVVRKFPSTLYGGACTDAAAGGTDDYVKAAASVKYAFVAELRGSDFVIDKQQIQPSFEEMWSGVVAMCDTIAAKENQWSETQSHYIGWCGCQQLTSKISFLFTFPFPSPSCFFLTPTLSIFPFSILLFLSVPLMLQDGGSVSRRGSGRHMQFGELWVMHLSVFKHFKLQAHSNH